MTNFFSPTLCAKLYKLGLEPNKNAYWLKSGEDWLPTNERIEGYHYIPAFCASDIILSRENLIELFGEAENVKYYNNDPKRTPVYLWQWEAQRLLNLHLSGQSIETELERAVEETKV